MSGHLNHLPNACFASNSFQHVQPMNTTYSYSSHLMSPIQYSQYSTTGSPKAPPNVSVKITGPFPTVSPQSSKSSCYLS